MITLKIVTERKMTPEQYTQYIMYLKGMGSIIDFKELEDTGETTFNHADMFSNHAVTTYKYNNTENN